MGTKTGTAGADTLYGGRPDTLVGLAGDDVLVVYTQDDIVVEHDGEGTDTVYTFASYDLAADASVETLSTAGNAGTDPINLGGNAFSQTIIGNYGANILNGHGGNDTLIGLRGDDIYRVYSQGDMVRENVGEGSDTVYTSASYQLDAGASVEFLSTAGQAGTEAINLTGNAFDQRIAGNYGANILNGLGGNDTLIGLRGDDIYRVYSQGDVVVEAAGEGDDTVYTSGSFTLTSQNSVETLSTALQAGTEAINLYGNELGQRIIGNYGNNVIIGGGGGDTLIGLRGDDTYRVFGANDVVVENAGEGSDTVYSGVSYALAAGVSVETLSTLLQAGTDATDLTGNELGQLIVGNYGDNVLNGGGGADTLIGLQGADIFRIAAPLGAGNVVTIADYGNGADTILLDPTVFTALTTGQVPTSAIAFGSAAADADDRLIYDAQTGAVSYDPDGTGSAAAMQFASIASGLTLGQLNIRVDARYTASVSSPQIREGDSGTSLLTFTVTLDHAATSAFSLDYTTVSLPVGAGAADGGDYAGAAGTLTFAAGQTSATVPVTIFGDTTYEHDESLTLRVSGSQLGASASGTGTILNDDTTIRIDTGSTYRIGSATGPGISIEDTYPGVQTVIFGTANGSLPHSIVFGPNSSVPGHVMVAFAGPLSIGTFDFSQLTTGIVIAPGADYVTSEGVTILPLPSSDPLRPSTITGTAFADMIDRSGSFATVVGGAGNDVLRGGIALDGGPGDDRLIATGLNTRLTGGEGSDVFVIPTQTRTPATNSQVSPNLLTDFTPGTDRIELVLVQNGALDLGQLDPARFHVGAAATTPDQRIIYDPETGKLYFDANGSDADLAGSTPLFALLPAHLDLTAASFTVVAP